MRKTSKSLRQSVLVEWEQEVTPEYPWTNGSATREHRTGYVYPNGTEIVLGGLDHPDRFLSTQYDLIVFFEAIEAVEDDWQVLLSRNRNWKMPFQQRIADTNPGNAAHWLNRRFPRGSEQPVVDDRKVRLLSRHWHNPAYYDGRDWTHKGGRYLDTLRNLTGPRRANLLDGLWAAFSGQVWPEYDDAVHRIAESQVPGWDEDPAKRIPLKWYFGSVDWGFSAPGVFQVWGVDSENQLYRVAEVYRTEQQIDWWAERAEEFHKEFTLQAIVCDPSRPEAIEAFNKRLGWFRNSRDGQWLARAAKNKRASRGQDLGGLDTVRLYLKDPRTGKPRAFFVRDALRYGPDEMRSYRKKPVCTEDEIPAYVNVRNEEGKAFKDQPDPLCEDHGCDATRYAFVFHYNVDLKPDQVAPDFKPGSLGSILGHDAGLNA